MLTRSLLLIAIGSTFAACGAKFHKKNPPAASTTTGQYNYNPNAPTVAPAARNYQGQSLNPQTALQGQGDWIQIDGQAFFVPNLRQTPEGANWEPYQNGRWTYDNQHGWTWVSNDPWGWMTDHYGVWRHHRSRGWIWMAFDDLQYQPHCVTWFDEGDNVGWYPMYENFPRAYRFNHTHGFDDGYWHGRSLFNMQASGNGFFFGLTIVGRNDVTRADLRNHMRFRGDRRSIFDIALRAHSGGNLNRVGRHPGGDRYRAFDYIQGRSHHRAPVGDAQVVRSRGGAQFLQPFNGRDQKQEEMERDQRQQRDRLLREQQQQQQRGDRDTRIFQRRDDDRRIDDRRFENWRSDDRRRDEDRRSDERRSESRGRPQVTTPAITPPAATTATPATPAAKKDREEQGQQRGRPLSPEASPGLSGGPRRR